MKQEKRGAEYGGILERFLAVVLDNLILLPFVALIKSLFIATPFLGLALNLALMMAYYVGFLSGPWRATPGKRVLRLYVVSTHSLGAMSKEQAAFRYITFFIPQLPTLLSFVSPQDAMMISTMLYLAWAVPILMTKERTAVHDTICNTRVMKGQL